MGTDILHYSGVVVTAEDAIDSLVPTFSRREVSELRPTISSIVEELFDALSFLDEEFRTEIRGNIAALKSSKNIKSLLTTLLYACVHDDDLLGSDILGDLFATIVGPKILRGLPDFSFEFFNSGRLNGYDVPVNVPCVSFDTNGLFKQFLTPAGKRLAKALGLKTIEPTAWTVLSY